jgi:hypothetical protein
MYNTGYFCHIIVNLCFLDRFLKNIWISRFIKVEWEPSSFTQTYRQDQANSCFCMFVYAPKNMLYDLFPYRTPPVVQALV